MIVPLKHQADFIGTTDRELTLEGGPGTGKTVALFLSALKGAENPDYRALLLTRYHWEQTQPSGMASLARNLYPRNLCPSDCTLRMDNGSAIYFGCASSVEDAYKFMGAKFQFIGVEEPGRFEPKTLELIKSRLRAIGDYPLRYRETVRAW